MTTSPTAQARHLVMAGKRKEAESVVADMIRENFDLPVCNVAINADWSSLNSLNGLVKTQDARQYFFKFHQEEGEESTVEEYYRADLLLRAGLPVDMPAMVCREPGRQILLYAYRNDRQLAAACLAQEQTGEGDIDALTVLQEELDRLVGATYLESLHVARPEEVASEAIHQLFHNRLVDPPDLDTLGGRVQRFYADRTIDLPGLSLGWSEFANLQWRINGVDYRHTIGDLFRESLSLLNPVRLAGHGAVVAHGDAHNANVWIEDHAEGARLVLFDPAFAGEHVPALLAEIKATFHNIFAHPLWLYHPAEAQATFNVDATPADGRLLIEHDWELSPLRRAFLDIKIEHTWRPLLAELAARDLLPANWKRIVRTAMFCCPTLVMNLSSGAAHGATSGRKPAISALSFAIAVMSGSEPSKPDLMTEFFDAIAPAGHPV